MGERFYRAYNAVSAHIPGTGLGLRMVQAIVSNHQGSFGLVSQEGRGTTAPLRLPLQRVGRSLDGVVRAPEEQMDPLGR